MGLFVNIISIQEEINLLMISDPINSLARLIIDKPVNSASLNNRQFYKDCLTALT